MKNEKVILVDLDGTYLTCNSFHLWIKFILINGASSLPALRSIMLRIRVVFLAILRKSGIINHSVFKLRIQSIWNQYFSQSQRLALLNNFVPALQRKISPNIQSKLQILKPYSAAIILTTAAPEEYVQEFVRREPLFSTYQATPFSYNADWLDNIRETKKMCTLDYLRRMGLANSYIVLFTDHKDDFPLIELCKEVHLLQPFSSSINELTLAFKKIKFYCEN